MTLEARVKRGSTIIFILSMLLIACLIVTSTLAYFAGKDESKKVLMVGGPVRVELRDRGDTRTTGSGQLKMSIDYAYSLPGMGVDLQAVAHLSSTAKTDTTNPTNALLRAIVDVKVSNILHSEGVSDEVISAEIKAMMINSIDEVLVHRVEGVQDGWVRYTDNNFYYCDKNLEESNVVMKSIEYTAVSGGMTTADITLVNGTFLMPRKDMVNRHSETDLIIIIRFEALQNKLPDADGNRIPNTIYNAKNIFDGINWGIHND